MIKNKTNTISTILYKENTISKVIRNGVTLFSGDSPFFSTEGLNFYIEAKEENIEEENGVDYIKHSYSDDRSVLEGSPTFDNVSNSFSFRSTAFITLDKQYVFKTYFIVGKFTSKHLNILVGNASLSNSYYSFISNSYLISVDGAINIIGTLYLNSVNKGSGKNFGDPEELPEGYAVFAISHLEDFNHENSLLFKLQDTYYASLDMKAFLSYDRVFSEQEVIDTSNSLMKRFNIST